MQHKPRSSIELLGHAPPYSSAQNNYSIRSMPRNDRAALSLPGINSILASMTAGFEEPDQPGQHNTRDKPQSPFFKQPLRNPGQPEVMIGIESLPDRSQPGSRAIQKYTSATEMVGTSAYGAVSGRRICEPSSRLDGVRKTPNRSAKRGRRYKCLSPPLPKQPKCKQLKIEKEQESRSRSAACFQNMEDFLDCVLNWEVPKNQAPGNVKQSGLTGDKQQTMEAFFIFCDVFVRHAISPLEHRHGETCTQAVAREAKHQIETHLRSNSVVALPTCSLMADGTSFDGPLCTFEPDHEPCLPDKTSACIKCRKQRRREVYDDNLRKSSADHGRASSATSSFSTR